MLGSWFMPFSVYVIRLRNAVLAETKFARRNPAHRLDKPCVYVGSTFHTPEHRYQQHVAGDKACPLVQKYHAGLHLKLTAKSPLFKTREEAEGREAEFAEALRRKGFGVWYG